MNTYTDITLRVENLPEEQARFLLEILLRYLNDKGLEGNVEISTKTEEEIIAEAENSEISLQEGLGNKRVVEMMEELAQIKKEMEYDAHDEELRRFG